jgi:hypothetical protein
MLFCFEDRRDWRRAIRVALFVGALALSVTCLAAGELLPGKPVVGKNADGQLEIFRVDANGELRHHRAEQQWDLAQFAGQWYRLCPFHRHQSDSANRVDPQATNAPVWTNNQWQIILSRGNEISRYYRLQSQ